MRLDGKTALVTGGSSGIGRAIALALADAGAAVGIGDVQSEPKDAKYAETDNNVPTHESIREQGGEAIFIETDVSDPQQCEELVETVRNQFGNLNILVNNAGISGPRSVEELSVEAWNNVLAVNLSGQFYCSKYALPSLKKTEGNIINISSVNGVEGGSGPVYAASKAGIINLTRDLATECGDYNVTVNAICPGAVRTANWNDLSQEDIEAGKEQTLLPRLGTPEDVAMAAVFLSSDDAEWITGEILFVDGGWSAHR